MIGLVIVTLTRSLAFVISPSLKSLCIKRCRHSICGMLNPNIFVSSPKIGPRRIHTVRVRGGNKKYRALRLDVGNFSWGSECKHS